MAMEASISSPRNVGLIVVGTMLGCHPGRPMTAGEDLATRLARVGYHVKITSRYRSRVLRLADIARTIVACPNTIDVQILQVYSGLSFILDDVASWLGLRMGHKLIMHVHGGAVPQFMERYPRWTCRVLRRADAIVVPSRFLERAIARYGFTAHVIPNAVDLSAYPYRHRRQLAPRLLWMRTFHPIYNPEMAIRVLARVKQTYSLATLVIAGQDKGAESDVRRLARDLNVDEAVRFAGFLNFAAKVREGGAADIFLNTNHIDNTPVSLIEACAMGLPIVTTNVGGISDLLEHRKTALFVNDNDDQAMAEAVMQLLTQPDLGGSLSVAGRHLAERLSWDQTRHQWDQLIADVSRRREDRG